MKVSRAGEGPDQGESNRCTDEGTFTGQLSKMYDTDILDGHDRVG